MSAVVLALSSGCGSHAALPVAPASDLSGRWQGYVEVPVLTPDGSEILFWTRTSLTLQLHQDGLDVGGPLHLVLDGGLDLPGTWSGVLNANDSPTTLAFLAKYQATAPSGAPCEGTFSGTLNVTTHDMQGSFNGNNCVRPYVGNLVATKDQ
jgi:hypothetical protein